MVVLHHIAAFPIVGHHAVLFFFMISGYLMTLVMHRSYGYSTSGVARFWANRALRLYPSYLVVIAVTVGMMSLIPAEVLRAFRPSIYLPTSLGEWLSNLTMIYPSVLPNEIEPRLSPATWAITVELTFYLLISLGLSRSRAVTWLWFTAGVLYHILLLLMGYGHDWSYFAIPAGSLPFSIGALIYHYREDIARFCPARPALIAGALIFLALIAVRAAVPELRSESSIGGLALTVTSIPAFLIVSSLAIRPWSPFPKRVDGLLGDIAYPLYTSHWIVAATIAYLAGIAQPSLSPSGIALFLGAYLSAIILSALLVLWIDRPIQGLRDTVREPRRNSQTAL
jgi:peptidoglycan/LPS O-acetylase OafA/YrhL